MNWCKEIDNITDSFENEFANLTENELNWKPDAKTWSIAQNLEHLIVINQTYFPILAALKAGTYKRPFLGRFNFLVTFFGKIILDAVKPDRKKKIKTFPIWEPTTSAVSGDLLTRFKQHQTELKRQIEDAKTLLAQNTVIASPANKNIIYRLETAFDIIVTHEQRHFEQAKAINKQRLTATAPQ